MDRRMAMTSATINTDGALRWLAGALSVMSPTVPNIVAWSALVPQRIRADGFVAGRP
jgi:hypothetical protein